MTIIGGGGFMSTQLELNLEGKSDEEMQLYTMQKQLDDMIESMGKVRRRLFSEISEMKKICLNLQQENENLKNILNELNDGKTEWNYQKNGYLFDVREYQKNAC